jgi:hypothetical protein
MTDLVLYRSSDPGLQRTFEELRAKEFSRLDESGYVYLDYTGSALYAASHIRDHENFLEHHVLGNPHSENPASAAATRIVEDTRRDVLDFFGADPEDYTAIFTANASAALKLVGESYPFEGSTGSRCSPTRTTPSTASGRPARAGVGPRWNRRTECRHLPELGRILHLSLRRRAGDDGAHARRRRR